MAVEIINSNKDIKFDCVDTWKGSIEHTAYDVITEEKLYDVFLSNIEPVKQVVNPIRMTSVEASKLYEDNSLDFVFIDASHEYEDVKADILAWLPKVKIGGILAGHDYDTFEGVNRAVDEIFNINDLEISEYCYIYKKNKEKKDKINVIVSCYNYANYLDLCLMSIFTQRVSCEVEIIFSDDNSTDDSFGIAERVANKYNTPNIYLTAFRQNKNLGELDNTNFLLSKCDGKYIAYLDADDYWIDPYKLEKQYQFLEKNLDYSMCFTGQLGYDGVHHQPDPRGFESLIAPFYFIKNNSLRYDVYDYSYATLDVDTFCESNYVFSSSRFFRNYGDLFKDYYYEFPYSDWPMNFELGLRGKIHYMNFATYVYRLKPNSLYHSESITEREDKMTHRTQIFREILKETKNK
jgi:glycosyltransferase involved in cell wall biosynthesis